MRVLLSIFDYRFFPLIALNILHHSFLACRVSVEKSADNLMDVPLYIICLFSLVVFNILSLSLIFVSLIIVCLGVFLLGFILPGTLCTSWTWLTISFPLLGKFSAIMLSNIFSGSLFSFWEAYYMNVGAFNIVPEVSEVVLIYFNSFFLSLLHLFPPFCSPGHFSIFCLSYSAIDSF